MRKLFLLRVPWRIWLGVAAFYMVWPLDIIPDVILGIGQVDDAIVLMTCLALAAGNYSATKNRLPKSR